MVTVSNEGACEPLRHVLLLFTRITVATVDLRCQLSARWWQIRSDWTSNFGNGTFWNGSVASVPQLLGDRILCVCSLEYMLGRCISKPALTVGSIQRLICGIGTYGKDVHGRADQWQSLDGLVAVEEGSMHYSLCSEYFVLGY